MAGKIGRILYATDYSKASERALEHAIALAGRNGAELLVVHVIEPVPAHMPGEDFGGAELYARLAESARREAEASMDRLMQRLRRSRVRAKSLLLKGVAYDQIIKAAKSRNADMIVIGTHGRTGLSRLFLGSVAARVVAAAPCPVLTVRGQ
ncbi:MAG TPA: universal stress protein [candidate division Zixibacteria bacterium]|nr:universal stress protein [candidate division Zixibacteria bacterium]